MRSRNLLLALLSAGALTGCPGNDFATCQGPVAIHPDGKCSAYYYQTDFGQGGVTTQAMTDCLINSQRLGGNVVAFHDLSHGIELRWIDAHTLEVAVPDGVKLESKRSQDTYLGYPLTYTYRRLVPADSAYSGCKLQSGGT